jgi:hypothetical protein
MATVDCMLESVLRCSSLSEKVLSAQRKSVELSIVAQPSTMFIFLKLGIFTKSIFNNFPLKLQRALVICNEDDKLCSEKGACKNIQNSGVDVSK